MAKLIITATLIILAKVGGSAMNGGKDSIAERQVATLFQDAGWAVAEEARGPDLIARKGDVAYVVEVKRSSEGRADRLIPLLAQAILQAQSYASFGHWKPLAIVTAPHVSQRVVDQVRAFASAHAPRVAVGIIDSRGFRDFSGDELRSLNKRGLVLGTREQALDRKAVDLFSDLNQWLIKTILAPYLDDPKLLSAPLRHYRNASELAHAARVSVMTAFRFLRQLKLEGFIHETGSVIRLVRLDDLLHRWRAVAVRPTSETYARWLLPGKRRPQIERAMKSMGNEACVGLFAAADTLRIGVVSGAATHFYVRKLSMVVVSRMQLVRTSQPAAAEVIVKVPSAPESVFRGAVDRNGIRCSDVLQVWLDVHDQPARGKEQAEAIYRRVIAPMLKRAKHGK